MYYQDVFGIPESDAEVWMEAQGLLTLEHCGIPAGENDGLCLTPVYLVPESQNDKLSHIPNKAYIWRTIAEKAVLEELTARVFSENRLIPIVIGYA